MSLKMSKKEAAEIAKKAIDNAKKYELPLRNKKK